MISRDLAKRLSGILYLVFNPGTQNHRARPVREQSNPFWGYGFALVIRFSSLVLIFSTPMRRTPI
jgi:hypothetical protein